MVLTLRTATVPLQQYKTPPKTSVGIWCFVKTCLKSDNFNSLMNAG